MNKAFDEFLKDKEVDKFKISKTVLDMLQLIPAESKEKNSTPIRTTGGFLRKLSTLSTQNGGGTFLPSEYFGKMSNNYYADVETTSYTDANPLLVRQEIPATFKGGSKKVYKFTNVANLKKYYKFANKTYAENVNKILYDVFSGAITNNRTITKNSLINSFNK